MTLPPSRDAAPRADGTAPHSAVCQLDAERGRLTYRGYDVRQLARQSTFEETAFLLVAGRLPRSAELALFLRWIRASQKLPLGVLRLLRMAPVAADPMAVLRTAISSFPLQPPGSPTALEPIPEIAPEALVLMARLPTVVAALGRIRAGGQPVAPRKTLSLAANFLYMLCGEVPDVELARAFDAALILRGDNELNPSTFAVRVAASTQADLCGCTTVGLATLAGPRHAGHTAAALRMLEEIGAPERVGGYVAARAAAGGSFPGFGHPVHRGDDPRTLVARSVAQTTCARVRMGQLFETARALEECMMATSGHQANVDFYLAPLYRALGIPPELFTPVFAVGRIAGWAAHVREQYEQPGLIRPRGRYVGPVDQEYVSLRRRR